MHGGYNLGDGDISSGEGRQIDINFLLHWNDHSAEMNDSLCVILEEFRDEREKLETYWTNQESFDRWIEKELAADAKLQDKEVEALSDL